MGDCPQFGGLPPVWGTAPNHVIPYAWSHTHMGGMRMSWLCPLQLSQRQKDKFVPLPSSLHSIGTEEHESLLYDDEAIRLPFPPSPFATYDNDQTGFQTGLVSSPYAPVPSTTSRGRITVYCVSEALHRRSLINAIKGKYGPQVYI